MTFFNTKINLANIPKHSGTTDVRLARFNGDQIYEAYQGNLAAAKILSESPHCFYQDAWLSLNLSVECLFKHFYFLILDEIEKTDPSIKQFQLGPVDYKSGFLFYHKAYKSQKHLTAKDFDHEVMDLWMLLDNFTTASSDTNFRNLKSYIPSKAEWIDARYDRRNHNKYQVKFTNYFSEFDATLNGIFRGLL